MTMAVYNFCSIKTVLLLCKHRHFSWDLSTFPNTIRVKMQYLVWLTQEQNTFCVQRGLGRGAAEILKVRRHFSFCNTLCPSVLKCVHKSVDSYYLGFKVFLNSLISSYSVIKEFGNFNQQLCR